MIGRKLITSPAEGAAGECAGLRGRAGWTLVAEHSDIASGKDDRRPGFQAALVRCRQLGAVLVAARLNRITRRAHTLSQLLEFADNDAADMPHRLRRAIEAFTEALAGFLA